MGDGIEPFLKLGAAAIASGIVGVIHGGLDSTTEIPGFAHEAMNYAPAGLSALLTATSKYGLHSTGERIGAGVISAGVSAATTAVGYFVGRVIVTGFRNVTG